MKRRRICSLLLASSLVITSLSSSATTMAENAVDTTVVQEESTTEFTTEDLSSDIQVISDISELENTSEQEENTTSENNNSEEVLSEISTEDLSTEKITSEETTTEISTEDITTENTTDEITTENTTDEEIASDTDSSTEEITEELTEDTTETKESSFKEKISGVDTSDLDFSSKELLVGTEDSSIFTWDTNVISEYNDIYLLRFEDVTTTENAYTYYYNKADFVSTNNTFKTADEDFVNDTTESDQVDLSEINQGDDALSILNDLDSINTPNKTIAVIDTGINANDLVDSISVIGDDPSDDNGHGTQMYKYIKEENPNAKILSIKALDESGHGKASDIYAAIEYAIESNVDIINLSLSANSTEENNIVVQAINEAIEKDIIVVGAAGNDGYNAKYYIPGCINDAIIVSAYNDNSNIVSNYGKTVDYYINNTNSTSEAAARMSGLISSGKVDSDKILQNFDSTNNDESDNIISKYSDFNIAADHEVNAIEIDGYTYQIENNFNLTWQLNYATSLAEANAKFFHIGTSSSSGIIGTVTMPNTADKSSASVYCGNYINAAGVSGGNTHGTLQTSGTYRPYSFCSDASDHDTPKFNGTRKVSRVRRSFTASAIGNWYSEVSNGKHYVYVPYATWGVSTDSTGVAQVVGVYCYVKYEGSENIYYYVSMKKTKTGPIDASMNGIRYTVYSGAGANAKPFFKFTLDKNGKVKSVTKLQDLTHYTFVGTWTDSNDNIYAKFKSDGTEATNSTFWLTESYTNNNYKYNGVYDQSYSEKTSWSSGDDISKHKMSSYKLKEIEWSTNKKTDTDGTHYYMSYPGVITNVSATINEVDYELTALRKISTDTSTQPSLDGIKYRLYTNADSYVAELTLNADGYVKKIEFNSNQFSNISDNKQTVYSDADQDAVVYQVKNAVIDGHNTKVITAIPDKLTTGWYYKEYSTNSNYLLDNTTKTSVKVLSSSDVSWDTTDYPDKFSGINKTSEVSLPSDKPIINTTIHKQTTTDYAPSYDNITYDLKKGNATLATFIMDEYGYCKSITGYNTTDYGIYIVAVNGTYVYRQYVLYSKTKTGYNNLVGSKYVESSTNKNYTLDSTPIDAILFTEEDELTELSTPITSFRNASSVTANYTLNHYNTMTTGENHPYLYTTLKKSSSTSNQPSMDGIVYGFYKKNSSGSDTLLYTLTLNANGDIKSRDKKVTDSSLASIQTTYYDSNNVKRTTYSIRSNNDAFAEKDSSGKSVYYYKEISTNANYLLNDTQVTAKIFGATSFGAGTISISNITSSGVIELNSSRFPNIATNATDTPISIKNTTIKKASNSIFMPSTDGITYQLKKDNTVIATFTMDAWGYCKDISGYNTTNFEVLDAAYKVGSTYYRQKVLRSKTQDGTNLMTDATYVESNAQQNYSLDNNPINAIVFDNVNLTTSSSNISLGGNVSSGTTKYQISSTYITTGSDTPKLYTTLKKRSTSTDQPSMDGIVYGFYKVNTSGNDTLLFTITLNDEGYIKSIVKNTSSNNYAAIQAKYTDSSSVTHLTYAIRNINDELAQGVTSSTNVNANFYYKEISTNDNYLLNTSKIDAKIFGATTYSGATVNISSTNATTGEITINSSRFNSVKTEAVDTPNNQYVSRLIKKDSNGYLLEGVPFKYQIYDGTNWSNLSSTVYTDSNGEILVSTGYSGVTPKIRWQEQDWGTLEIKAHNGSTITIVDNNSISTTDFNNYLPDENGIDMVDFNSDITTSTYEHENTYKLNFYAKIIKTSGSGKYLEGVPFKYQISEDDGISWSTWSSTIYTDNNGEYLLSIPIDTTDPDKVKIRWQEQSWSGHTIILHNGSTTKIVSAEDYVVNTTMILPDNTGMYMSSTDYSQATFTHDNPEKLQYYSRLIKVDEDDNVLEGVPFKYRISNNGTTWSEWSDIVQTDENGIINVSTDKIYLPTDTIPKIQWQEQDWTGYTINLHTADDIITVSKDDYSIDTTALLPETGISMSSDSTSYTEYTHVNSNIESIYVKLHKSSGVNTDSITYKETHNCTTSTITNGLNPNYSLEGVTYNVYSDIACNNLVGTLICDTNGNTNIIDITNNFFLNNPTGANKTYYAKETVAGKNYILNTNVIPFTVTKDNNEDNPYVINTYDDITTDPININLRKVIASSMTNIIPTGTIQAKYRISYYPADVSQHYTVTQLKALDIVPEITDISLTYNTNTGKYEANTDSIMPSHSMGYLIIEEIQAPTGFNITGSEYIMNLDNGTSVKLNKNEIPIILLDRVDPTNDRANIAPYLWRNNQRYLLNEDETESISIISAEPTNTEFNSELTSTITNSQVAYINGSTTTTDHAVERMIITNSPENEKLVFRAKLMDLTTGTQVQTSNRVITDSNRVKAEFTSNGSATQYVSIDFGTYTAVIGHTYASVVDIYGYNIDGDEEYLSTHNADYSVVTQKIYSPVIGTSLKSDTTNTNVGTLMPDETLVDTITYRNIPAGTTVTFSGDLYDITDITNPIKITSTPVTTTVTVSNADNLAEKSTTLSFDINAVEYQNKKIAAVVTTKVGTTPITVLVHNSDYSDANEIVYFPSFGSELLVSSTGTHLGYCKSGDTAVETAYFQNIPSGVSVSFIGELYDITSGTPELVQSSTAATGSKSSSGYTRQSVALSAFTYDSRQLSGHILSAKLIAKINDSIVGEHNVEFNDDNETIYYPITSTELTTNSKKYGTPKASDTAIEKVYFSGYPANTSLTFNATLYNVTDSSVVTTKTVSAVSTGIEQQTVSIPFSYNSSTFAGKKLSAKVEILVGTTVVDSHNASYNVEAETIYYPNPTTIAVSNTTNTHVGVVGSDRIKETIYFNGYKIGDTVSYTATLVDTSNNDTVIQTTNRQSVTITSESQTAVVTFDTFNAVANHKYAASVRVYTDDTTYTDHNASYTIEDEAVYYPAISTNISSKVGQIRTNETVTDTVTFSNFPAGTNITFNASLIDITNNNAVIATNNTVTAVSTGTTAQTKDITFSYDSTNLRGHVLTARVTAVVSGTNIVTHNASLNEVNETIYYPTTSTVLLTSGEKYGTPKTNDTAIETVTFSNIPTNTIVNFRATLFDVTANTVIATNNTVSTTSTKLTAQTANIQFSYDSSALAGHKLSAKVELYVNNILIDTHNANYSVEDETIYYTVLRSEARSSETDSHVLAITGDTVIDTIYFSGYPEDSVITLVSTLRDVTANSDVKTVTQNVTSTGLDEQNTTVDFGTFTPIAGHKYSVKVVAQVAGYSDLVHNGSYDVESETVYAPIISTVINRAAGMTTTTDSATDTVTFTGFPDGTLITFTADLVDITNGGNTVIASNNTVTATSTGVQAQTVAIPFAYNSTELRGHTLTARITAKVGNKTVFAHNTALNDVSETIYYPTTSTTLLTNNSSFGSAKANDSAVETVIIKNYPANTALAITATLYDVTANSVVTTSTANYTSTGLTEQSVPITFSYNSSARGGHKLSAKVEVRVNNVLVDTHNTDYSDENETIYYPVISTVAIANSTNSRVGIVASDTITDTITFSGYPAGTSITFISTLRDITAGSDIQTISNIVVESTGIEEQTKAVTFNTFTPVAGHTYSVKVISRVAGYDDIVHNGSYNIVDETVYYPSISTLINKKIGVPSASETINDTVTFSNFPAGTVITFNADLVDVNTNTVIASNNTITATSIGTQAQTATIPFTYNSSNLADHTLSVRVTAKVSGNNVVSHNIALVEENETIYYPSFATDLLSASTSSKLGSKKVNETARETVTFKNIPAGTVLSVTGELYNISGATPVLVDTITGSITSASLNEQTVAITDLFTYDSTVFTDATVLAAKLIVKIGNDTIAVHNADYSDAREKIYYMSVDTGLLSTYGTHYYKAGKVTANESSRETVTITNVPNGVTVNYTATLVDTSNYNTVVKSVVGTYTSTGLQSQTINVDFTNYDARGLAGHILSSKVELSIGNNLVGAHNTDYTDLDETIYYPTGYTTAADADTTTKLASNKETATIYDDFYFSNLAKGMTYTVTGVVHKRNADGTDGGVLKSNNVDVTKTITMTVNNDGTILAPQAESVNVTSSTEETVTGKVRLSFTVNASLLEGITTTVFETVSVDNITVFVHNNINDMAQQIHFMKLYTLISSTSTNKSIGALKANESSIDVLYFEKIPYNSTVVFSGELKDKSNSSNITTSTVTLTVDANGNATSSSGNAADVTVVKDTTTNTVTGTIKLVYSYDSRNLNNKTLVSFVTAKHNDVVVALHNDINDLDETLYYPNIYTNAKDANTNSNVSKLGTTQIIDTITLNNLVIGNTYTITGTVNVKNEDGSYGGVAVDSNNANITKTATITISDTGVITLNNATNSTLVVTGKTVNGTVDVVFDIDNSKYLGKDFVVYESLYTDNILLAAHDNLNDVLQTIHNPKGSTQAMDAQTQDEVGTVVESGNVTLVDTVSLVNLPVGKTYRLDGTIMDKSTNTVLKNGTNDVKASVTFTVNANGTITAVSPTNLVTSVTTYDSTNGTISGSAQLNFTVPSSLLANKDVVVYESGYVVVSNTSSVLVFQENELSELTQTVHFPDMTSIATDDTYQKHVGIVSTNDAITEKLTLYNLVYGKTYTVVASLVDQITGSNLKNGNNNIEKTVTITINNSGVVTAKDELNTTLVVSDVTKYDADTTVDATISIPFVYDSTSLSGKAMVVYGSLSHNNVIIKTHNDINNTLQQIHYYELGVKKTNLTDASHAIFRVEHNNELVKFIKISDGVYNIVVGNVSGAVTDIIPLHSNNSSIDGTLIIRGFEDGDYVFTEVKTEAGKSLLSDSFTVTFNPTSADQGKLENIRVSTSDKSATITSTDANRPNVGSIDIINNDIVQLEAGGSGTTIYYIIGGVILLLALALLGFFLYKKKKKSKDNV